MCHLRMQQPRFGCIYHPLPAAIALACVINCRSGNVHKCPNSLDCGVEMQLELAVIVVVQRRQNAEIVNV
jgi:hypothetical protein